MSELVYLDSSALVKLVVRETESLALLTFLGSRPRRISSVIAAVEVPRAIRRAVSSDSVRRRASQVLSGVALLALDRGVIERAAELEPRASRTLDAIHLASALSLGADLECFVVYDERLGAEALRAGLRVVKPT